MKWFKNNGILFSIFLALALFSYLNFKKDQTNTFKKKKSYKIFSNLDKKNILSIDFYIQSKLYFQLKNIKKKWFVVSHNIKDLAKPAAVSVLLTQFFKEKKQFITDNQNLADYKLKPPQKSFVFYFKNSKQSLNSNLDSSFSSKFNSQKHSNSNLVKKSVFLGSKSFDNKRFISFSSSKKIFVSESPMNFAIDASFNSLRSKKLFIVDTDFDKIILKNKTEQIVLHKKNKFWVALSKTKKTIKLDKLKVTKFISQFKHLEADQFIRENILNSKAVLKNYNLIKPDLFLSVFNKQKKIWSISVSENKKKNVFYAKIFNKSTIYSLTKKNYHLLNISLKKIKETKKIKKITTKEHKDKKHETKEHKEHKDKKHKHEKHQDKDRYESK